MASFRINYSRVISQANTMNGLSYDLLTIIRKLERTYDEVRTHWEGPASKAYQQQLERLICSMKNTQGKMDSVASTIKTVARRIQLEDERAAERAKKLK